MSQEQSPDQEVPYPSLQHIFNLQNVKNLQDILSVGVGAIAVLTVSGVIVVNSYLMKFTTLAGYSIVPAEYIAPGLMVWVIELTAISALVMFARSTPGVKNPIRKETVERGKRLKEWHRKAAIRLFKKPKHFFLALQAFNAYWYLVVVLNVIALPAYRAQQLDRKRPYLFIFAVTVFVSLIYGTAIYPFLPRSFGGGQKVTISVIFKENIHPADFGLSGDPNQPDKASVVSLLADLTNGILVLDESNGHVVALRDDAILGLVEARPYRPAHTITLTAVPSTVTSITPITLTPISTPNGPILSATP